MKILSIYDLDATNLYNIHRLEVDIYKEFDQKVTPKVRHEIRNKFEASGLINIHTYLLSIRNDVYLKITIPHHSSIPSTNKSN